MVVLAIVTQKDGETVYFDEQIPKLHYIKLISCSLFNSCHNLTRVGGIFIGNDTVVPLPEGHYTAEGI